MDELLFRVIALLRRANKPESPADAPETATLASNDQKTIPLGPLGESHIIRLGDYSLNTRTFMFSSPVRGEFRVTPVQYTLLYHLMSHPNTIFSPALLLEDVWDHPNTAGSADLVRVHVKNLREAIEEDPQNPLFIKTIKGYGYTIQSEELEAAAGKTKKVKSK